MSAVTRAGLMLCMGLALACDYNTGPSNPPPSPTPTPSRASKPATQPAAKPAPQPAAKPKARPDNQVELEGLRFTIMPRLIKQGVGVGVDVAIRVESTDGKPHVIYGLKKGVAFGGIRFGNMNGGMPLGEGGSVTKFGRTKPGAPLTIGRSFPGDPAPGGGWTPLVNGDSLVLSLRTWHTLGEQATGSPRELSIGAVSVTVSDTGQTEVRVEKPKAQ